MTSSCDIGNPIYNKSSDTEVKTLVEITGFEYKDNWVKVLYACRIQSNTGDTRYVIEIRPHYPVGSDHEIIMAMAKETIKDEDKNVIFEI